MKQGWEIKKLGDLCNLMTGGTPSRSKKEYFEGGTIKWLVSGDIHKREIFDCEGRITELGMANSNAKLLPINAVMIALNGQGKTRGTVAILRTNATCNQSLVSIYPKDTRKLLPEFIFCNLHGRYEEIRKITGDDDNDRRGLNMPLIRNIEIPLPPLPEQQRIVSILDEAFAAIAKAKANAEQNLKNAKELFESYLQGVFDPSTRSGQGKGDGWEIKTLGEVSKINYGYTEKASFDEVGPKFLRITDIQDNGVDWGTVPYCKCSDKDLPKYKLETGDIVFARTGATTGKSYLINNPPNAVFASYLIRLRMNSINEFIPEFISYFFQTKTYWDKINAGISGSAQGGFNATKLGELEFHFPKSKEAQQIIVRQLDALRAETQKLEAVYQQKIADLEELKKSILQKAFAGELKTSQEVV
jgi:type I restriction enzyme S subunit